MQKDQEEKKAPGSAGTAITFALASILGWGGFIGFKAYRDIERAEQKKAAIKNAVEHSAEDALTGKIPVPVDPDKLADILATDPEAQRRWDEAKKTMSIIEDMAAEKRKHNAETPPTWKERTQQSADASAKIRQ